MGCLCDPVPDMNELAPLSRAQQQELIVGDNSSYGNLVIKKKKSRDYNPNNTDTAESRTEQECEYTFAAVSHKRANEDNLYKYASRDSNLVVVESDSPLCDSEQFSEQDERYQLSSQLFNLISRIDETLD